MTARHTRRAPARRSLWRLVLPGLAIATIATSAATAQDKGTAGISFLWLAVCYLVNDALNIWSGNPFR